MTYFNVNSYSDEIHAKIKLCGAALHYDYGKKYKQCNTEMMHQLIQ